tara:strand:+ start:1019 stop:1324 length:306 start_codon:yes stop_codon:yes gene_type:complete
MKSFKGAAHCWSDVMHNPTWDEMRKRSEPIAGKGGGNDPALANAQKMRGAAKAEGPAKSRKGDSVSWKYGKGTYSGTCINDSCSRARTENGKVKILPKNRK